MCCIFSLSRCNVGSVKRTEPIFEPMRHYTYLLHGLLCDMQARGQQNSCHTENHATNVLLFIGNNLQAIKAQK